MKALNLLTDSWLGLRSFWKQPGVFIAAVATLAIGVGSSVTVFAFVDALLLRPLPFGQRSDQIVTLHWTHPTLAPDWSNGTMSMASIHEVQSASKAFVDIGGYLSRNVALTRAEGTDRIRGGSVTPNLFRLIAVQPVIGRPFVDADAAPPGFEQVVLLSHSLWSSLFAADPAAVGKPLRINGRALTVIGVMPPSFQFPERDDLWLPYKPLDASRATDRNLFALGLMAPGVSLQQAQSELDRVSRNLESERPELYRNWTMRAVTFRGALVGSEAPGLLATLMGSVLFVLMVGCANLANLLLTRGTSRQQEMAIRSAIGASRLRLIQQVIAESLSLAGIGGVAGLIAAAWAIDFLTGLFPEGLPHWAQPQIDFRVLCFTIATSFLTVFLFALWPALRVSEGHSSVHRDAGSLRATISLPARRLQRRLVTAQVALCMVLLVASNLMIRNFVRLMHAESGFDDSGVLSFRVAIAGDAYDPAEAKIALVRRLETELRALPGVLNAAATTAIPMDDGGASQRISLEGRTATPDEEIGASAVFVTSSFLSTIGLEPVQGRSFTETEAADPSASVVLISSSLAREFWPSRPAIGERIRAVISGIPTSFEIVGVVPDIQFEEFGEDTVQSRRNIYYPYARIGSRTIGMLVRSATDPRALLGQVRQSLTHLDPNLPAFDLRTMTEVRAFTTMEQRLLGQLIGAFSAVGLLLACLGIYGVLAYLVQLRTPEIGVRVTLGATSRDILRLVWADGLRTVLPGFLVGIVLSAGAARLISDVLYQKAGADAWTFLLTAVLLGVSAAIAISLPARKAARIAPFEALRAK